MTDFRFPSPSPSPDDLDHAAHGESGADGVARLGPGLGLGLGGSDVVDDVDALHLKRLLERLEQAGALDASEQIPAGLVDRVFSASLRDLRRGAERTPVVVGSSLRLVAAADADRTAARGGVIRRFGPAIAMAACIGLAFVIALPSMTPLLRGGDVASAPSALGETPSAVEPVLAALLQRGAGQSEWRGVDVIRFSPDQFRPISPDGLGNETRMAPIVETREASFSDFADEFARIRDAAKRSS